MKTYANLTLVVALSVLTLFAQPARGQQMWYEQYQDLAAIYGKLDDFANDYPNLVTPVTLGQSWEGRDIRGIKIGGSNSSKSVRPAVLLNGTQHAHEWISPMTNMFAAEQLLTSYGSDAQITSLLDDVEYYVIPVVNPDGYVYSWTTNRNWRKNRRPGLSGTGVDLNRNWDFGWGLNSGSSGNPADITYRGPAPFSELETQAMRDFYYDHQNIVANIDFHSYSQLVLAPFGYTDTVEPADGPLMNAVGSEIAIMMQSVNGEFYQSESASDLYLASGISIDWTYGDQNVYSYTIELRPDSFFPGFELPADEIIPTAEEAFAAVLHLGNVTATLSSGDFDYDGDYDCADIDALAEVILNDGITSKYEFDVNGDGSVTAADVPAWLTHAGALPGDANLDGVTDITDFNVWNSHKFTQGASWCTGDFSGDGVVDVTDYNVWNTFKFQSANGALVPEPAGVSALCLATLLCFGWLRRLR